jgi:gluconokinase
MIVIVFGVSGAGKTTIGKLLAQELGWRFIEGDDFHPAANVDKLRKGIPLTDEERQPWLARLRERIERCLAEKENAVLACSALKNKYRELLKANADVKFVYLRGDYGLIADRLRERKGHFMKPQLLQSQFADLEEPQPDEEAVTIEARENPREVTEEIRVRLRCGD